VIAGQHSPNALIIAQEFMAETEQSYAIM